MQTTTIETRKARLDQIASFGGHIALNDDGSMSSWHFSANVSGKAGSDLKLRLENALYEALMREFGYHA